MYHYNNEIHSEYNVFSLSTKKHRFSKFNTFNDNELANRQLLIVNCTAIELKNLINEFFFTSVLFKIKTV